MRKSLLRLLVLSTPLMLGACGEGWEAQRTDTISPYGNKRTAGTGVVYVRAKMMPEKELNLEPVTEEEEVAPVEESVEPEPQAEAEPVLDAEEIFTEAQTKGGAPVKKEMKEEKPQEEVKEDKHTSNTKAVPDASAVSKLSTAAGDHASAPVETAKSAQSQMSAEDYILQAPKQIDIPQVEIIDAEPVTAVEIKELEQLEQEVAAAEETVAQMQGKEVLVEAGAVEIYENTVAQPATEIVVPKKDFLNFKSKGQANLDEIYYDPLMD